MRQTREERGWSQEHLADEAGVDRSYMSGIERGVHGSRAPGAKKAATTVADRNISVVKLSEIARALGVALRDLLP